MRDWTERAQAIVDQLLPDWIEDLDFDQRRIARLLVFFAVPVLMWAPVFSLGYLAFGLYRMASIVFVAALGIAAAPLVLRASRSLPLAGHWVVAMIWGGLVALMLASGGLHGPGVAWLPLVPMFAQGLIGRRAAVVWLAPVLLAIGAFFVAELQGVAILDEFTSGTSRSLAHTIVIGALAVILLGLAWGWDVTKERTMTELRAARDDAHAAHVKTRMVLDNVAQGFLTLSSRGCLDGAMSAAVQQWFPRPAASRCFGDLLRQVDERTADWFDVTWDVLVDDVMPLEVALAQLPRALQSGRTDLAIEYRPITEAGSFAGMIVVLTDVTAERAAALADEERRLVVAAATAVHEDREGFLRFLDDARNVLGRVEEGRRDFGVARALHTLKGNCGLLGLTPLARRCHELEDGLAEGEAHPEDTLRALRDAFDRLHQQVAPLLGRRGTVELAPEMYEAFLGSLRGSGADHLAAEVESWRLQPLDDALRPTAQRARQLAERLARAPLEVVVDASPARVNGDALAKLLASLAHVVRNAVDHGIEPAEERVAKGKPAGGRLALTAAATRGRLTLEIADDGRGIDWSAVGERAARRGLPTATHADLVAAVLTDGLTTREQVTRVSGRGAGMAAVREAVEELGGSITAMSEPEVGTTWTLTLPLGPDLLYVPRGRAVPEPVA